jgi:hypothetical protein
LLRATFGWHSHTLVRYAYWTAQACLDLTERELFSNATGSAGRADCAGPMRANPDRDPGIRVHRTG